MQGPRSNDSATGCSAFGIMHRDGDGDGYGDGRGDNTSQHIQNIHRTMCLITENPSAAPCEYQVSPPLAQ